MLAVALALSASLSWGVADFIGGIESRRLHVMAVLLVSQATGLVLLAVVILARGEGPPGLEYLAYGSLSGIAGVCALAAFYRGLAIGAMAVVTPISATAAVIPVGVGIATGERPSAAQAVGIALAIVGVVLAARERDTRPDKPGRMAAGAGLAVVAALGFGLFFVAIDKASDGGDAFWATAANRSTSVTLLVGAALILRPPLRPGAARAHALMAVGALDVSANALFALASNEDLVSVTAVLASLYPVVVIALARAILGERVERLQLAGAGLALCGVALISGG